MATGEGATDVAMTPVDAIASMIANIMSLGGKTGVFLEYGENLLFGLTVIAVAWAAIKNVMEDKGVNKVILDFAAIALLWGIASWTMTGIVADKDGKEVPVVESINSGFDLLAGKVMTTAGADSSNQVIEVLGNSVMIAAELFMPSKGEVENRTGVALDKKTQDAAAALTNEYSTGESPQ